MPDGLTLTSPGPGDALISVSATVPTSTSVAPGTKPAPFTVNGAGPASTGPAEGSTSAAMLTGTEPLRVAPGEPGAPLPTRSW